MTTRLPEPLSLPWERKPNPSAKSGTQILADGRTRDLWLVFVLLRHRPGVYARVIRAPDYLAAERAVAIADHHEVLETLGAQLLGRRLGRPLEADGAEAGYRSVEVVSHRFLVMRQKRPLDPSDSPLCPSSRS
ncbi:MAG TPA: hypothetical protein VIV12_03325 [Streptosporangiaceae bacterium]